MSQATKTPTARQKLRDIRERKDRHHATPAEP
jgi:hypothetical protein